MNFIFYQKPSLFPHRRDIMQALAYFYIYFLNFCRLCLFIDFFPNNVMSRSCFRSCTPLGRVINTGYFVCDNGKKLKTPSWRYRPSVFVSVQTNARRTFESKMSFFIIVFLTSSSTCIYDTICRKMYNVHKLLSLKFFFHLLSKVKLFGDYCLIHY